MTPPTLSLGLMVAGLAVVCAPWSPCTCSCVDDVQYAEETPLCCAVLEEKRNKFYCLVSWQDTKKYYKGI